MSNISSRRVNTYLVLIRVHVLILVYYENNDLPCELAFLYDIKSHLVPALSEFDSDYNSKSTIKRSIQQYFPQLCHSSLITIFRVRADKNVV